MIQQIEQKLRYRFKKPELLKTALTHSSYANEFSCVSNERLEFLGDAVIGSIVSAIFYEKYPTFSEGDLSQAKAQMVSEKSFARYARELDLGKYLRLGKGEKSCGGGNRESNLEDAFEALVGAIYLDAGYARTFELVMGLLENDFEKEIFLRDPKTELQEIIQRKSGCVPEYRVVYELGPQHRKTFITEVRTHSDLIGTGEGSSKKRSEQAAARDALSKLKG